MTSLSMTPASARRSCWTKSSRRLTPEEKKAAEDKIKELHDKYDK